MRHFASDVSKFELMDVMWIQACGFRLRFCSLVRLKQQMTHGSTLRRFDMRTSLPLSLYDTSLMNVRMSISPRP